MRCGAEVSEFWGILSASVPSGLLLAGATAGLGASFRLMRFPDLTIEGSFLIGASVWAAACLAGWGTIAGSVAGMSAGALCGTFTAVLSRVLGVDRFLAGILVTASCYSIALLVLGVSNLGLFDGPDALFTGFDLSGTPWITAGLFALTLLALTGLFFSQRIGIRARIAAINPRFLDGVAGYSLPYLIAGLAFTNALAATSGIAFARFQGFVDIGMGNGVLIVALAGFAIGEALVRHLPTSLVMQATVAAAAGSVLYQVALAVALSLGVPAALTKLVSALIVLGFLVIQSRRGALAEHPL